MKPVYHLVFAVAVTLAVIALFLPQIELTWQILLLAAVSGVLPDFDHWLALWKGVSIAVFATLFVFFASAFENVFPGRLWEAVFFAFAASAAIAWILWVTRPFHKTIFELRPGKTQFPGSGTIFLILYTLIVFLATNSVAYAFVAFLAYASHWVLDALAYETRFGRRFMLGWPEWWKPEEYHIERLKREQLKKEREKQLRETKQQLRETRR